MHTHANTRAPTHARAQGVVVARTVAEAFQAVDNMLVKKVFGGAGDELVIEEFLDGEEASFFALVDGEDCVILASAQVGGGGTGGRRWRLRRWEVV